MKTLIVVANHYNGHELWCSLGTLKKNNIKCTVIARAPIISDEITGFAIETHFTLDAFDIENLKDYACLLFISGNMADTEAHWKDSKILSLVHKAIELKILIGAICCSVPIIREAARDKRVSFFPLLRARDLLREAGAILSTLSVTIEDKLITAENQMVTQTWIESIANVLKGIPTELNWTDVGDITRQGLSSKRKVNPEVERLRSTQKRTSHKSENKK